MLKFKSSYISKILWRQREIVDIHSPVLTQSLEIYNSRCFPGTSIFDLLYLESSCKMHSIFWLFCLIENTRQHCMKQIKFHNHMRFCRWPSIPGGGTPQRRLTINYVYYRRWKCEHLHIVSKIEHLLDQVMKIRLSYCLYLIELLTHSGQSCSCLQRTIEIRGGSYIASIVSASVACFCVYAFG